MLTDLNSFVNLDPKALDREIIAHAKGFIVLANVGRTKKEMELLAKASGEKGRSIDITNFAENLREDDKNSIISIQGQNLETPIIQWRGVNPDKPKKIIDKNHSFISRFPYIDPRFALLSSISEMLFHGKHLSEKQIKEVLIANVESTIKYNLENEAKRTNAK
jgi:hypothetical protein